MESRILCRLIADAHETQLLDSFHLTINLCLAVQRTSLSIKETRSYIHIRCSPM